MKLRLLKSVQYPGREEMPKGLIVEQSAFPGNQAIVLLNSGFAEEIKDDAQEPPLVSDEQ